MPFTSPSSSSPIRVAVLEHCRALLGPSLLEGFPVATLDSVADAACADIVETADPNESAFAEVIALREATYQLDLRLTENSALLWKSDTGPPDAELVECAIAQLTRPLEPLPAEEDVWDGKCKGTDYEGLRSRLLRAIDPGIWSAELREWRERGQSPIEADGRFELAGLDRARTVILLVNRLAAKQRMTERFLESQRISVQTYIAQAIVTLHVARTGPLAAFTPVTGTIGRG